MAKQRTFVPSLRRDQKLVGLVLLVVFLALWPAVAGAKPGMGGMIVVATGTVGPGGLVIDYTALLKKHPKALPVTWDSQARVLRVGGQSPHSVSLAPWEMRDLLHVARVGTGRIEVSVDRAGGGENFYVSPELRKPDGTPTDVGLWMQQGDLQFADVVQGPGSVDAQLGQQVSPEPIALDLLENDANYRKLSRDLVVRPSSWPTIYFEIKDLNAPEPKWRPDYQLRYFTPSLDVASPDGNGAFIEKWMTIQANRPYEALTKQLTSKDDSLRRALILHYPALAASARFATALPALVVFCESSPGQCLAWERETSDTVGPAAPIVSQSNGRAAAAKLADAWKSARLSVALAEPNPDFRRWIFVDEAIYSLTAEPRFDHGTLLSLLPSTNAVGFGQTKTAVELYRAALDALFSSTQWRESAIAAFEAQAREIHDGHNVANREFWEVSAALAAIHLSHTFKDDSAIEKRLNPVVEYLTDCWESVVNSAQAARDRPQSKNALGWRTELGRAERCRVDVMRNETGLYVQGAFHFAIGWASASAGRGNDARDRLRMLTSIAYIAKNAEVREALAVLISRLDERVNP